MTKDEVGKILFFLRASYPGHFQKFTGADYSAMVDAWSVTLQPYTFEQAFAGAQAYVSTDRAGFPPSAGQIVGCIQTAAAPPIKEMTAGEMWDLVYKAIENLQWDRPEVEWNKLPRVAQKIVGSPEALKEIAAMPTTDVLIGEKARFMHRFDIYMEKEHKFEQIPQKVRDLIHATLPEAPRNPDLLTADEQAEEWRRQGEYLEMLGER